MYSNIFTHNWIMHNTYSCISSSNSLLHMQLYNWLHSVWLWHNGLRHNPMNLLAAFLIISVSPWHQNHFIDSDLKSELYICACSLITFNVFLLMSDSTIEYSMEGEEEEQLQWEEKQEVPSPPCTQGPTRRRHQRRRAGWFGVTPRRGGGPSPPPPSPPPGEPSSNKLDH